MDMTQIDEQWVDIPKLENLKRTIVSVSNTGLYRRADGTVGVLSLRHRFRYCGKRVPCYRVIAEHFLITVKRPDQTCIDHITHNPTEYNVNNVLNLRWCTSAENSGFEEARDNVSKALRGKYIGDKSHMYGRTGEKAPMYGRTCEKNPNWKGDNVSPMGAYRRAQKLYKSREISEEEFQPYRDAVNEERRQRRMAKKTSSPI